MDQLSRDLMNRIESRFARLYGDAHGQCMERFRLLIGYYERKSPAIGPTRWDQATNLLITYAHTIHRPEEPPLETLSRFLDAYLRGTIDHVHILPFFPYSSDDGFSVIDYRHVDPSWGDWDDIASLGEHFGLMFDLVVNHCSRHSAWFREYAAGIAPARHYFIEADPEVDLSQVVRPRSHPLLTRIDTHIGERWVWTTFSDDQIDLNFANPDVVFEFLDILLDYVRRGATMIRLDAIAYLWKQIGTECIHLPQTHEIVKLFRDVLELMAPHVILITETNVPHDQNISYFGKSDEAHVVYNFPLPPLLLHAMQRGSAEHLTDWAESLQTPPVGCTFLNFTASHDGIGVRPLEGLLDSSEIDWLIERVKSQGGLVSVKSNADGSVSPYELNITYLDAMGQPGERSGKAKVERFLCSQAIAMVLRGIPGMYIHSLLGTPNDTAAVHQLGYHRAINRHTWDETELLAQLDRRTTTQGRIFHEYRRMLALRSAQPAFHPDAPQTILRPHPAVFAVRRTSIDRRQIIVALNNVSDHPVTLDLRQTAPKLAQQGCVDLLSAEQFKGDALVTLEPRQVRWLTGLTR